jgi:hypothetical protein
MRAMTLARLWRRQLCASCGAALIVPGAMLAALVALVLGGSVAPAPSPGLKLL